MIDVAELQWVSIDDITQPVRELTGVQNAAVTSWDATRLVGGAGEDIGVWRLAGQADVAGISTPWSLVVKGWKAPEANADPRTFNWPHREMELYRSGALADLPGGIRAPTCYGSLRGEDGSVWVWLEDITGGTDGPRTMDDYAAVARRLGQFNGAYVNGAPLPRHRALSQGWIRQWTEEAGPSLELLAQGIDHPFVQQAYPPHVVATFLRLWERRHELLDRLDRMPHTFAHLDAFRRNIFMWKRVDVVDDVVLIDWSFTGIAALGEEVSALVVASVLLMESPFETIEDLQESALAAYIAGLKDAGWNGNDQEIRDTYLISAPLRYGVGAVRVIQPILLGLVPPESIEQMVGRPFDDFIDNTGRLHAWIARTAREQLDLL